MYSRSSGRDLRVPHNYGGNAFGIRGSTPVEDLTRRRPPSPPLEASAEEYGGRETPVAESDSAQHEPHRQEAKKELPTLSPIGEIGAEELLLIALALIIFQSGKEPQLALILLALLFVQ